MADAKQEVSNGSSQSRIVLAKPRLGAFGSSTFPSSSSKICNPFGQSGSVLRPPQLKAGTNPFLKAKELEETNDKEKNDTEKVDRLEGEVEAPKFVPLGASNVTPRTNSAAPATSQPSTATSSSGFVFGQNLSERVVMENVNNGDSNSVDHSSTNGTTELLFTSATAFSAVKENSQGEGSSQTDGAGGVGLAAAAAAYERARARPPPPRAAASATGEEDEVNVLQISARLFAWEAGSWRERGRGVLRLNEPAGRVAGGVAGGAGGVAGGAWGAARLVARVAGSLRVVLNTKLWADMVVERAGSKSLRITAADAQQQIKLYLIMGAPSDINQLERALSSRVALCKRASQLAPPQPAERLKPADDAKYLNDGEEEAYGPGETRYYLKREQTDTETNKTDQESSVDEESKSLKRKETADDDTSSPKRQCPEILIE